jgi:putative alpha-1,2-mannosidase
LNYKKVFDPSTNLMRGRNEDGNFQEPFNPLKWGDAFTEGNSLHYTWSVFHDIQGLIDLMGGDEAFINQPIQHMIYLYNYSGVPYKAQKLVRDVLTNLYSATPDGYCGDEDNGQTSAWYVFSALGFYPVTPGVDQYVIGSPLFDKATLELENGNRFTIRAKNNSKSNHFIQEASLNGREYTPNYIQFQDIQKGGEFVFTMDANPNMKWGAKDDDRPYSLSREQ